MGLVTVRIGLAIRVKTIQKAIGYFPPMTCRNFEGVVYHLCGSCARRKGDLPPTGRPEEMRTGVPEGARCGLCGKPAFPADPVDIRS